MLTTYLRNINSLPVQLLQIKRNLKVQKTFMKHTIIHEVEKAKMNADASLSEADFNKIKRYYSLAVPAILGEGFCLLRNKRLSEKERKALTYLGGLTGLFDDFFDKKEISNSHIQQLITNHNEKDAEDAHERLFVRFYNTALENIDHPELFSNYVNKVFEMQILSRRQTLSDITEQEIANITYAKGGYSLLFYRGALENVPSQTEEKALYMLGGLLQLENDLFDVYKDYRDHINTLVTTETNIRNLRQRYFSLMESTTGLIRQMPLPAKKLNIFLRFISLVVFRGIVCLDQLESKQKTTNHIFSLGQYKRKDLICDMEKANNILRVLHYYGKGW